MMVVIVSGLSFAGYFATRWLGASRGIIATAAAGAMISSTAVTAALATRLRDGALERAPLIAGIAAASAVMFLRVLVMTGLVAPFALPSLAIIVGVPTAISLICMVWFLRRAIVPGDAAAEIPVRNPLDLRPALILVGLVMVASMLARFVLDRFGDAGLATVLTLTGMLDVDSAIITMSGLPPDTLEPWLAGLILSLPVMLNTLLKSVVAISIAGWKAGWQAALPLVLSAMGALAALPYLLLR